MDFADDIASHRSYLLRFARLQLRNEAWAEDAVSETLLAALARPQAFANRSQLRTWLVGILKHKVIDQLRARARECSLETGRPDDEADPLDHLAFDEHGEYAQSPADWGDPEQALRTTQFLTVLEACAERLPAQQGRVFLMREWLELSADEICKELGLSATNLYVLLHRARLRLRECLDLNWFGKRAAP